MLIKKLQTKTTLTTAEKAIVQYLLEHLSDLSQMTISLIAARTCTSNPTVIRLCKKFGYPGWREFKMELLKEAEAEKYTMKSVDYSYPFAQSHNYAEIAANLSSLYKESIDIVNRSLHQHDIERFAQLFLSSRRIFLYALGDSMLTAMSFCAKLAKIGIFPHIATEIGKIPEITQSLTKEDCAVFITYSGNFSYFSSEIQVLWKNKIPMAALTANEESPIRKFCMLDICIPDMEHSNKTATFYSQLSFQYVLNLVYSLLYHAKQPPRRSPDLHS